MFKFDDVRDVFESEIKDTLKELGHNAQDAQNQINRFLDEIEPQIDDALVSQDLLSLNLIRDRIAGRMGRVSLKLLNKERDVVLASIMSTLRTLMKAGLGLIAAL